MTIKAIETKYKGYRFRSRLEARWAVFFDALGMQWEYEPEGFDLGDGVWYLPDFKVKSLSGVVSWYEVRPFRSKRCEKYNAFRELVDTRGKDTGWASDRVRVTFLSGDPLQCTGDFWVEGGIGYHVCPSCKLFDFGSVSATSIGGRIVHFCTGCRTGTKFGESHVNYITECAKAARSARFEHGERPFTI